MKIFHSSLKTWPSLLKHEWFGLFPAFCSYISSRLWLLTAPCFPTSCKCLASFSSQVLESPAMRCWMMMSSPPVHFRLLVNLTFPSQCDRRVSIPRPQVVLILQHLFHLLSRPSRRLSRQQSQWLFSPGAIRPSHCWSQYPLSRGAICPFCSHSCCF